jgi:hypothetical protein
MNLASPLFDIVRIPPTVTKKAPAAVQELTTAQRIRAMYASGRSKEYIALCFKRNIKEVELALAGGEIELASVPWTEAMIEKLKFGYANGLSPSEIAERVGHGTNRGSIIGKASKLRKEGLLAPPMKKADRERARRKLDQKQGPKEKRMGIE